MSIPCLLLQLKKAQELQKQMLWDSFQEKNKQLERHHQIQLEQKIKVSPYVVVNALPAPSPLPLRPN